MFTRVLFYNQANVCSIESDGAVLNVLQETPSVSLLKTAVFEDENGDGFPEEGETITYSFTIKNTGNSSLTDLQVIDDLLEDFSCSFPSLPAGASEGCTATYTLTQADIDRGQLSNQARVQAALPGGLIADLSDDPNDPTDYDANGDGEPDDPTLLLFTKKPMEYELFNAITPNNDGLNDYFKIKGIGAYPENRVQIFNRWGVLVWETDGYTENETDRVFRGISNGRATLGNGKQLPTGTYFYILQINGLSGELASNSYSGYLYLN